MAAGSDARGGIHSYSTDVRAQRRLKTWLPRERPIVGGRDDSGGSEQRQKQVWWRAHNAAAAWWRKDERLIAHGTRFRALIGQCMPGSADPLGQVNGGSGGGGHFNLVGQNSP